MNVIYQSSGGVEFDINGGWPIRIKEANFHKWEWRYQGTEQQYGVDVGRFEKEPCEYEATIYFRGSKAERSEALEAFHEASVQDIVNQTPGKLIWGAYYINCYVLESSTFPHDEISNITVNEVTFFCPYPFWVREQAFAFSAGNSSAVTENGLDYEYNYEFDYADEIITDSVNIEHYLPCHFKMLIYGACTNPSVTIGGVVYQVFVTLGASDYLEIDSRAHTATVYRPGGIVENAYNARYKETSIFTQIPTGRNAVVRNSDFAISIVLFLERNEPKWN